MLASAVVLLAACQSKPQNNVEEIDLFATDSAGIEEVTEVYKGILTTPEGEDIGYLLTLNAEINGPDTLYTLDMVYLDENGVGQKTTKTKGKQQKVHKVVNHHPKKGVKLTPNNGGAPMYFLVVNDTTLRLVNDSLVESTSSQLYDIVKTVEMP